MTHTKGTGNYSANQNWLWVDQCGFGEQCMHSSKSAIIGKDSKKHMVLHVKVFHGLNAGCEASARSEKLSLVDFRKAAEVQHRIRCL